ncbi:clathrin coat assembly protein AP180-like [Nicotiana sylvestris]|uniref:Clathrin coat assembly protein AP180-like n=2 Tax=Nicotiana TaxID=4085 RepID=A0A1S4DEX4_TOBAC|nr:PREDICTED: clathrin coat assembly protein AP180-like [Nicotiana sylvestris]XP_016512002.1 PREDICTED: clathrin coat assembly protein AP180-like [Nicotiana tabacum]
MPSKLKKAIAAVKDQTSISIAKVSSNTSATLEVAVLKATTHDDVPVDERYIHEVVQLVSSNKSYAAACARAISKRIGRTRNWIVALKSLMLVLRIFQDGDPYFPREVLHAMKKGAKILNLSNFRDDSNSSPWDFTAFIRTFALYLDERLDCFLIGKLQRRYNYKERENSRHFRTNSSSSSSSSIRRRTNEAIREMKPAMLLDKISYWQRLLERAIAIRPTGAAKTNCLVQVALYAVVQESFDLYKDVSDGLTLVLDSFFHLPYQFCVNAFQTCVKAAKQFEEINSFYSFCKSIGVGRTSEYPSVQNISEELIESLQEFLKDQSSFPVKSSGQLLLQKPGSMKSSKSRHDSYGGQSEFSVATTEPYSERSTTTSGIGSPCSSLEELIRATETGRKHPSISIDLEAYSDIQFRKQCSEDVCDTGSARSLPVSMIDLVSSSNWPGDDEYENNEVKRQNQQPVVEKEREVNKDEAKQEQPKEKEKSLLDSSSAKGWEAVLNEALTPSPSPSFGAFPEQQEPKQMSRTEANASSVEATSNNGWDLGLFEATPQTKSEQPMPNTTANKVESFNTLPLPSFNAFQERQEQEQLSRIGANVLSTEVSSCNNGWDLALFEATPQTKASQTLPITSNNVNSFNSSTLDELYNKNPMSLFPNSDLSSLPIPNMNGNIYDQNPSTTFLPASNNQIPVMPQPHHYNPFLQDTSTELPSNKFSSTAAPTFQATPTFSAQDFSSAVVSDVNSDPFGTFSSSEQMLNGTINQKNLLHEQQLWLQNQNKIIAKHMS